MKQVGAAERRALLGVRHALAALRTEIVVPC